MLQGFGLIGRGTLPFKGSGLVFDAQGSVDPDDPFNTGTQGFRGLGEGFKS